MDRKKMKKRAGTIDRETAEFRRISKEEKVPFIIEENRTDQLPINREERRKIKVRMIRELANQRPGTYMICHPIAAIAKRTANGVKIVPLTPKTMKELKEQADKKKREEGRRIREFEKKHKKKLV